MADLPARGRTLWEMFWEWLRGQRPAPAVAFLNPLDLRPGAPVRMAHANGKEYADRDFTVQEIRAYGRRIGGKDFPFTDYVLRGINTKTFDADDVLTARLRAVPNRAGAHDTLLLRLEDEFAFAEDFLGVLKDDTGLFEVTDDATGSKETFSRINDLRESYEAEVLVIAETSPAGQAVPAKSKRLKLEYWDYWRDRDTGKGEAGKDFLFVERNSETGWFQIWRGREFYA